MEAETSVDARAWEPEQGGWPQADKAALWVAALPIVSLLLWLYYPTLTQLCEAWRDDEYYTHGVFVPFISAWLIWSERAALGQAWRESTQQPRFPWLLSAGLLLQLLGTMADVNFVRALSIPLVLLGLAHFAGGRNFARRLRFPLGFFILAIPFSRILTQMFTVPLQNGAASCAGLGLGLIGLPIERDGVNLYTPLYHFVVAVPCSGLKTTITLLTVSILMVHFLPRLTASRRVLLCILSIPIAVIVNTARIMIIVLLGHYFGRDVAEGFLHGFSGLFVFALSLGLLFALGNRFAVVAPPPDATVAPSAPASRLATTSHETRPPKVLSANTALSARLLVPAAMLLGTAYIGAHAVTVDASGAGQPQRPALNLPDRVGPWRSKEVKVDPSVYEVLVPDAVVQRRYYIPAPPHHKGATIQVDVIALYNKDPRAFHTPDVCLKSAGWTVTSDTTRAVRNGAKSLNVDVVAGQRKQEQTHIAYFFADTSQNVTGWIPSMIQSATARALKRQSGVVQVQYGFDPRLEQPDGSFDTAFRDLIFAVAESIRRQPRAP